MPYTYNPLLDAGLDQTSSGGGGTPGGSNTQIQFNDSGSFGGDADLTYNKTTNALTIGGDVTLNDGGSFTTTLQTITPTANRTVSLPDATGTVALVAGSSGQLLWNNAGANAGASTLTYDGSILTTSGRFINSYNATASAPAKTFTGTWFTGGTATTTKPQVLIEPTGATSTAWSTSGTGLGVNAASGFAGNLLDLQVNGTSRAVLTSAGRLGVNTISPTVPLHVTSSGSGTVAVFGDSIANNTLAVTRITTNPGYIGISASSNAGSISGGTILTLNTCAADGTSTVERVRIDSSGRLLLGTTTNTGGSLFQVNDNRIRIATAKTPASATDTGSQGEVCWDSDYIYVCTATNTWKRAALATW